MVQERAHKKYLRVTFPDNTVFCFNSCRETYIEVIKKVGTNRLGEISLEVGHLPLFSKEVYPSMAEYMFPIDNTWYVNMRSSAEEKYRQLLIIKEQLGLDYTVELGDNFITSSSNKRTTRKTSDTFLVLFPNGECINGASSKDVYLGTLKSIGLELIRVKCVESQGKEVVTRFQKYSNQVPVDGLWVTLPGTTKDKIRVLDSVKGKLKLGYEIISSNSEKYFNALLGL